MMLIAKDAVITASHKDIMRSLDLIGNDKYVRESSLFISGGWGVGAGKKRGDNEKVKKTLRNQKRDY